MPHTVTVHHHEEGRWEVCARLFCHDPKQTGITETIGIRGLKTRLYLYQAFGVFVMFEMEMFQGGGWNADDIWLGKVGTSIPSKAGG